MNRVAVFTLFICVIIRSVAANEGALPSIKLAADRFPSGHESPEGVAADLARAFIGRDKQLFMESCLPPFGGGVARTEYEEFLKSTSEAIKTAAEDKVISSGAPVKIGKVFAARHLSSDGPASYAYAVFNFQDVMFVDVGVLLADGNQSINRTFVAKRDDGLWYVHPVPGVSPLLSAGLNSESPSTEDFSVKYEIVP